MLRATDEPLRDNARKQEFYRLHKSACDLLKKALDMDDALAKSRNLEGASGKRSYNNLINCYWTGITALEKAIQYFCTNIDCAKVALSATEVMRARSTCDKMRGNKQLAADRVQVLENLHGRSNIMASNRHVAADIQINKLSSSSCRKTTACVPVKVLRNPNDTTIKLVGEKNVCRSSSANKLESTTTGSGGNASSKFINDDDIRQMAQKALQGLDCKLVDRILNNVLKLDASVSLDDIQGQAAAKQALQELVILPAIRPELFTGLRAPINGLLLFGPPGNGKTMLAKAVAGKAGLRFFNISASALTSKWVGEGEMLVKALFACAKALQPAVIFVDEIDSLLKTRSDNDSDSLRRLETEFFVQFDGTASSQNDRILVMGATNRPWDLDDAAIRRFPKRVCVGLPDDTSRQMLLSRLLRGQQHSITTGQLGALAAATEGYSGSDLTNLARDAALGPVLEHSTEELLNLHAAKLRRISEQDFRNSLKKIRPSCSAELIVQLDEWNDKFGEKRRFDV